MPLTAIVTIVLRIFSLLWLVDGILQFINVAQMPSHFPERHVSILVIAVPLIYLACAFFTFLFSHPIARIVTPPPNAEVNLGTLTRYDLYCFAFTFLGLYFFLSSIADALNWLHIYIITAQHTHEPDPQRSQTFYRLTRPLITALVGLATLVLAPRLAHKLTTVQQKQSAA